MVASRPPMSSMQTKSTRAFEKSTLMVYAIGFLSLSQLTAESERKPMAYTIKADFSKALVLFVCIEDMGGREATKLSPLYQ